jgi:hypothetical protein
VVEAAIKANSDNAYYTPEHLRKYVNIIMKESMNEYDYISLIRQWGSAQSIKETLHAMIFVIPSLVVMLSMLTEYITTDSWLIPLVGSKITHITVFILLWYNSNKMLKQL